MKELLSDVSDFLGFLYFPAMLSESLSTKLVVNLALYYKTIENLGTERHVEWAQRVETGDDIGCFGLTELGHGSNVMGIMTTAHYDKSNQEFILNTPSSKAMKFWIGGAGYTSTTAVIFAQLIIDGKNEGPHAFLVKLRDIVTR